MGGPRCLAIGLAALPLALGGAAREAAQPVALPGFDSGAWSPLRFASVERASRYTAVRVDGRRALRAESDCSASALAAPLDGVDLARTPILGFSWRVERALDHADERSRAGDDFAARVYVTFPVIEGEESLLERLRRSLAERLYGRELPGAALCYVWAGRAPAGSDWPNPYEARTHMRVLRSGGPRGWQRERVDVVADFRRFFGRAPPEPTAVAVMTDADDTCARARAWFADFRFLPRSPAESPPPEAAPPEAEP